MIIRKRDGNPFAQDTTRLEKAASRTEAIDLLRGNGGGLESRSNDGWRGGYRGRGRENNLNRGRLHSFGDRFWNGFSP